MKEHQKSQRVVAVTGAGGFLGMHVVAALEAAGLTVRSLVGPPGSETQATFTDFGMYADICDASSLREFVAGAGVVVHMAGPPSVAESLRHPATFARTHVEGTTCVLEACRLAQVRQMVYLSSAEIYGVPLTEFVDEDHPLRPRSAYAAAKIGAESMIAAFASTYDLCATILRPFSVYGPGASAQSLIGELIRSFRAGGPVSVRDFRPVRDYVYVGDVAAAVVSAAGAVHPSGVLHCNLGTMRGTSVQEVCRLLAEACGSDFSVTETPELRRPSGSEILRLVANNRRAQETLGWRPSTPMEAGLRLTAKAMGCA